LAAKTASYLDLQQLKLTVKTALPVGTSRAGYTAQTGSGGWIIGGRRIESGIGAFRMDFIALIFANS
jgi:hypothetical protein